MTSLAHYILQECGARAPGSLRDDHNRPVDALKLNVTTDTRNNRIARKGISITLRLETDVMNITMIHSSDHVMIFASFESRMYDNNALVQMKNIQRASLRRVTYELETFRMRNTFRM